MESRIMPDGKNDFEPLLSVIVPVYNIEPFLDKCITSIIKQSYQNIEIILVNDGSTDNSYRVCKKFADIDNRIKLINKCNGGLVSARKAGLKCATGQFATYVDGDDWVDIDLYEKMLNKNRFFNADIISMAGCVKEFEDGKRSVSKNSINTGFYVEEDFKEKILPFIISTETFYETQIPLHVVSHIFKRELLFENQQKIDDRISFGEDAICFLLSVLEAKSILLTEEYGYHYRLRSTSITQTYQANQLDRIKILYKQMKKEFEGTRYQKILSKKVDFLIIYALLMNRYDILLKNNPLYLFPYTRVVKHSKIVLYGAGAIGKEMMRVLNSEKNYDVVLWVDRGFKTYREKGLAVESPDKIVFVKFDYIIITVADQRARNQIKNYILSIGVPEEKIAETDMSVISAEAIPEEFTKGDI